MRFRLIFLTGFLCLSLHPAFAQNVQGGINFLVGVPRGEFKRNVDKTGFGVAGTVGWAPAETPVMLGLELGFMVYGSETRRQPFSTTIPNVFVDVNTSNNFLLAHLIVRGQPNQGTVRPYIQGMVGMNYLFTRTKIENSGNGGDEIASSDDLSDNAFSYGGGGGLTFLVWTEDEEEGNGLREVLIDVGARYVLGKEARYLKEGSIAYRDGRVVYDVSKSKTDLLELQVGAAFRF
jgi:hypothetical protein